MTAKKEEIKQIRESLEALKKRVRANDAKWDEMKKQLLEG